MGSGWSPTPSSVLCQRCAKPSTTTTTRQPSNVPQQKRSGTRWPRASQTSGTSITAVAAQMASMWGCKLHLTLAVSSTKAFYSFIMLALVDANFKFMYVDVGYLWCWFWCWIVSCGLYHVDCIIWTVSCGLYHVDCIMWTVSYGLYHVDCIMWTVSCGLYHVDYHMDCIMWIVSYGLYHVDYHVDCIIWIVSYGLYHVDCIMWTVSCGLYHVDCIMWTVSYGLYHVDCISRTKLVCHQVNPCQVVTLMSPASLLVMTHLPSEDGWWKPDSQDSSCLSRIGCQV